MSAEKTDPGLPLLRHCVATLAYRAGKALRGASPEFASWKISQGTRTPVEILAHMGDLFDWAMTLADGKQAWNTSTPREWQDETARFFRALESFDRRLASGEPLACTPEQLFQGPVADALTHTGQLTILRRMAGGPIRGESYFRAHIETGRVGLDQAEPKLEFE